jgi:hypothetical protein
MGQPDDLLDLRIEDIVVLTPDAGRRVTRGTRPLTVA